MLKKGGISKLRQKASQLKDAGVERTAKFAEQKNYSQAMDYTQSAAMKVFVTAHAEMHDCLDDDKKFLKVTDAVHDEFPPKVRLFLRKKRFRKIMLKLREKYRENDYLFPERESAEIIKANFEEGD